MKNKLATMGLAGLFAVKGLLGVGCDEGQQITTLYQQPTLGHNDSVPVLVQAGQQVYDERETFTELDLDGLKPSMVTDVNGPIEVLQYLRTGPQPTPSGSVIWAENEYDEEGFWLFYDDGDTLFSHELEFVGGLESKVDVAGNLTDLEEESLNVLGQNYRVTRANTDGVGLELHLLGAALVAIQDQQQVSTYAIDGTQYDVSIGYTDTNTGEAGYIVNGEWTGVLAPGKLYELADGTMLGHLKSYGAGAIALSEFGLRAHTLEWIDENITDAFEGAPIPYQHGEAIEEGWVRADGWFLPNGNVGLSRICYRLQADATLGDLYVGAGETVSEHLDEPEGLPGRFDFGYAGQCTDGRHVIEYFTR